MQRKKPEPKKKLSKMSSALKPVKNFDHGSLPPVIYDGILQAPVGSKLLVSRLSYKKLELHTCTLEKIDAKYSVLELFDQVTEQMYVVSLKERLPEVFKILKHGVEAVHQSASTKDAEEKTVVENSESENASSGFVITLGEKT